MFIFYGSLNYYNENLIIYPDSYSLWNQYSDNQKFALLQKLSFDLDREIEWIGVKYSESQKLQFPRDFSNFWIKENNYDIYFKNHKKIPEEIFQCMLELINNFFNPDGFKDLWNRGVTSINDGVISVGLSQPKERNTQLLTGIIDKYLFYYSVMGYTEYRRSLGVL